MREDQFRTALIALDEAVRPYVRPAGAPLPPGVAAQSPGRTIITGSTAGQVGGDYQAFTEFYAGTFHSLCTQVYLHTGNLAEAQDVVQEAFTRALPRWADLSSYQDPAAWVRKVAWNLATSRWRRVKVFAEIVRGQREEVVPGPTPDRVALQDALAKLPAQHRQAIVLHYLADASVSDIADITGAAENTVKTWLHRGRAALARHLGEEVTPDG